MRKELALFRVGGYFVWCYATETDASAGALEFGLLSLCFPGGRKALSAGGSGKGILC